MQEAITILPQRLTIPVIDSPLRFPHFADMLTHDEIKAELLRQIDAGEVKQADVARWLNIAPARISEVRRGVRRIQQAEMPVLAVKLGLSEPAPAIGRIEATDLIPDLGKVAQGVWLEQSEPDPANQQYVAYDRLRGDPAPSDLFAVTPDGTSMNLAFPHPDTKLICRRASLLTVRSGDYVIAERAAHNLHELTCKRFEIDEAGDYWLHPESDDPRYQEPWHIGRPNENHHTDQEIAIVGRVIRAVRDFERGRP